MENINLDNDAHIVENENVDESDLTNIINIDYLDTRINQLKLEKQSDINSTRCMRIFFGGCSILFVFEIFTCYFNWNKGISILLFFISFLFLAASFSTSKQSKLKNEIESLEQKKKYLLEPRGIKNSTKHFDTLVSINIKNLDEYYNLVKKSNKNSFNVSLGMTIIGILFIMIGLAYSYFNPQVQQISYIISASGVVIEIVSGLLFYLYNRSVIQLKEYHDSLINVQNVLLSFKLIDDLKSEEKKSEIMRQMIEYLVKK